MRNPAIVAVYTSLTCLLISEAVGLKATESDLVLLISLSRHGSRAPNPSVKANCPNNLPNIESYTVPLEQLTESGMKQMEEVGDHIRQVYVNEKAFLSSTFNGPKDDRHFEGFFRADAANRCGQSAVSMGYGLYPKGTGPDGYSRQPIPVYMQLPENEHDFTANGPCWSVMSANNKVYTNGRAALAIDKHKQTLETLAGICGKKFYSSNDPVTAIKDVTDMFLFDQNERHDPIKGLTPDLLHDISELAFQHLIERLYSTPTQITVSIGGFPQLLVRNLREGATLNRNSKTPKYLSYHGHRELMHGLGFMMGMKFNFEGLPQYNGSTPLHPASTLFFELHRKGDDHFVQLFVWSPFSPRTAIKLDTCDRNCPLNEFTAIIENHIQSTGPWQDICSYHPVNVPAVKGIKPTIEKQTETISEHKTVFWSILTAIGLVTIGGVGVLMLQHYVTRRGYQSI